MFVTTKEFKRFVDANNETRKFIRTEYDDLYAGLITIATHLGLEFRWSPKKWTLEKINKKGGTK